MRWFPRLLFALTAVQFLGVNLLLHGHQHGHQIGSITPEFLAVSGFVSLTLATWSAFESA